MFKAAFALGAVVQCFSGSFAGGFLKRLGDVASFSGFSLSQLILFHVIFNILQYKFAMGL